MVSDTKDKLMTKRIITSQSEQSKEEEIKRLIDYTEYAPQLKLNRTKIEPIRQNVNHNES